MPILTYFTIFVLIALFLVLRTFVVVPMREAVVVERLGRFRVVLPPGFHFLIPFADRIAYRHETREQVIDIPSQACITRDNIQVEVDGLVYLQVLDPHQASYGIEDYRRAGINLAQTTMRAEIGKLTLGQSFYERESLNETIVQEIDKASNPWGIKVLRYELRNITPSANVVHTLEKQMEAEREKARRDHPGFGAEGGDDQHFRGGAPGGDQPLRGGDAAPDQRRQGTCRGHLHHRRRHRRGHRADRRLGAEGRGIGGAEDATGRGVYRKPSARSPPSPTSPSCLWSWPG